MAKNRRIGIIRARHDTTVPTISDAACTAMLMTSQYSVFRYWRNTTRNYLDFIDSPQFPWVDIMVGADTSRAQQAKTAIAALRARFPDHDPLAGLDGLIVLVHPGTRVGPNPKAGQPGQPAMITIGFDGGATNVAGFPVAVVQSMTSDHTFMCHELGHVLGFEHSFGLDNNGADWDPTDANIVLIPEYGSPYDLMSSASFGSRWLGSGPFYSASPTFVGPSIAGWPNAGAFSMGPHLSRANLHLKMPEALIGRVIERPFPQPGGTVIARLVAASKSSGTCLLILHPPGEPASGIGRVYIEYRTAKGWDAGMDPLGPSLSRDGVVVHSVVDQPNAGPRVWYRGSIPTVSVDRDVAVAPTSLIVKLEDFDSADDWADVSVTVGAARSVEIVRGYHSDDMVGVVGELQQTSTPCGDPIRKGTFATATTSQFGIRTTGFGGVGGPGATPPTVAWTVGGVAATGRTGSLNVPFDGVTFAVQYTIDPVVFELQLTSRGGERFAVPVVVTVIGDGVTVTASATFIALGWFDGIHPEDAGKLGACLARITDRYRVVPAPFRKPTPDPAWSIQTRRAAELLWFDKTTRLISELPGLNVEARSALEQIVHVQVQSVPTMLERLQIAGIDFSVPEADLLDWLNNAEFTPYPALAEALLQLLGGMRLRQQVYLDVIVFNYENSPGNPSPRKVEDVNSDVLELAVVEGFNTRYGEAVSDFRELLVT